MPHLLDLYCGTKSVSNAFAEYDWKTTTVDIDPACKPDICKNVLKLTKADLPDDIDAIWASPLCTQYSRARTTATTPRDLALTSWLPKCWILPLGSKRPTSLGIQTACSKLGWW